MTDYLTNWGAHKLATDIHCYWSARGVRVSVWVEEIGVCDANGPLFQVRSDLGERLVVTDRDAMLRRHGD